MNATAEILPLPILTKRCPHCGETKLRADFYTAKDKKDGCSVYCRPCFKKLCQQRYYKSRRKAAGKYQAKIRRQAGPRMKREWLLARFERHIFSKYGMKMHDLQAVLHAQHNLCANRGCGAEISLDVHGREPNRAVVDHDHDTGKFRGLLCNKCNHAEGFYTANKNRLIGIIEYLDRSTA